jgi:hypothetical protein
MVNRIIPLSKFLFDPAVASGGTEKTGLLFARKNHAGKRESPPRRIVDKIKTSSMANSPFGVYKKTNK